MSRNPALEALHAVRYDWDTAEKSEKPAAREKLQEVALAKIERSGQKMTVQQLLDITRDDYKDYRRMRRREGWSRLKK